MGRRFLNLKLDLKELQKLILLIGLLLTIVVAMRSHQSGKLSNGNELQRNEAGAGAYEQELYAWIEGEEKVPLKVLVEERTLTGQEAEELLLKAEAELEGLLKGENESLQKVSKNLNFPDEIPDTPVEVVWSGNVFDYFHTDGTLREEKEILEPVELEVSAVLTCQDYSKDFKTEVVLWPGEKTLVNQLSKLVEEAKEQSGSEEVLTLPRDYEGKKILWKKPVEQDAVYFLFLTIGAVIFLQIGSQRDIQQKKKMHMEQLEKEYAQIVSKFVMLLSAGLSVRHAWERIVYMEQRKSGEKKAVYEEMNWALREMQKGVPELEVYEKFGQRIGQVHYKKLMAAFVSYKKRGGGNLLDLMNQEMLETWDARKRKTRQQGEVISTKLLLPMMGMLSIVFVMILVPAFLSFRG